MSGLTAPLPGGLLDPRWAQDVTDVVNTLTSAYATVNARQTNPPICGITCTTTQSIPNSADTYLNWNAGSVVTTKDSDTMSTPAAGDNRVAMTVRTAGVYLLIAQVHWATTSANGARGCTPGLVANPLSISSPLGIDEAWQYLSGQQGTAIDHRSVSKKLWYLWPGTTLGIHCIQNAGVNVNAQFWSLEAILLSN